MRRSKGGPGIGNRSFDPLDPTPTPPPEPESEKDGVEGRKPGA